ncbi:MAG: hypothetical protein ABIJ61_06575 [bacterium]
MDYSEVTKLEQQLISSLKEEYSFFQSLFILVDKQRDQIKYDRDQRVVDLHNEMERLYRRIAESEATIGGLRDGNRKLFALAASAPEVRRLANSIGTLVSKSLKLVAENRRIADDKHQAIREKLAELQRSTNIADYLRKPASEPCYLDKRN